MADPTAPVPTPPADDTPDDAEGGSALSIVIAVLVLLVTVGLGAWTYSGGGRAVHVAFLLSQVALISIVIWQACDPFADAAQWIGETLQIPGSVRGATLDAIASSMPELFTSLFFVILAVTASGTTQETLAEEAGNGYGAAIATCAGSAVYNMILIPAICALFISIYRRERPTIEVEPEVLARDGMWFLGTSVLLIGFLFQDSMTWWMGVTLLGVYAIYIGQLWLDARRYRRALEDVRAHFAAQDDGGVGDQRTSEEIADVLRKDGFAATRWIVEKVRASLRGEDDEDGEPEAESAGVLFGLFEVPLNMVSAWVVITLSTIVAASACYWLVMVTESTAEQLGAPLFFVAVILAAAASSVPDTFLSIGAAKRGDDSGAVSNAFGSNIFDICICLGIPLLVSSYLLGWEPVGLTVDGEPMAGLVDLRIILAVLTLVTLLIMWHDLRLTRGKALVLCGMYCLFIAYAVAGSFGFSFSAWFAATA